MRHWQRNIKQVQVDKIEGSNIAVVSLKQVIITIIISGLSNSNVNILIGNLQNVCDFDVTDTNNSVIIYVTKIRN